MKNTYVVNRQHNDQQEYYWFQNGFSKSDLVRLQDDLENISFKEAETFGPAYDNVRKSRVKWIPQEEQYNWLYELMEKLAIEANGIWNFDIQTMPEQIQYTEYLAEDAGHYTWHQDIGPNDASLRKISITIQLSDAEEYEGGDLQIWKGGDSVDNCPRGAGVAVIFPSYMMHRVTPVSKGIRKSLVLWIGGSHYK